jgi:hypothetical protein
MSYLLYLPHDVEKLIYRNVHEMNMREVMTQLREGFCEMNDVLLYLQRKAFYPYRIRLYILKEYAFKETSIYYSNKVCRYIHYKLFSRCLQLVIRNQHIIF